MSEKTQTGGQPLIVTFSITKAEIFSIIRSARVEHQADVCFKGDMNDEGLGAAGVKNNVARFAPY